MAIKSDTNRIDDDLFFIDEEQSCDRQVRLTEVRPPAHTARRMVSAGAARAVAFTRNKVR